MFRHTMMALILSLAYTSTSSSSVASNLVELGSKPKSETILAIGSAPVKQKKPMKLGALRTNDAVLPPPPLTRQERMLLRAKHATQRQKQVGTARRSRTQRNQEQKLKHQPLEEEIVLDDNNVPVLQ